VGQMINLKDVTFLIPLKIESDDRKVVLDLVLCYMLKHLDTNIIICEEGSQPLFPKMSKPEWGNIKYIFRKNDTELFHKTKNLNMMAKHATTPIIVSQDSDVIFYPHQYQKAAQAIRGNIVDFCYPFNQPNHNISKKLQTTLALTLNLQGIEPHLTFEHPSPPPGGCFFMNKQKFFNGGGENENFVSWGPEDIERRDRFIKLGYKIVEIPTHERKRIYGKSVISLRKVWFRYVYTFLKYLVL
jgi:predicted glycosyltransferase involved in capsule biosynthesis